MSSTASRRREGHPILGAMVFGAIVGGLVGAGITYGPVYGPTYLPGLFPASSTSDQAAPADSIAVPSAKPTPTPTPTALAGAAWSYVTPSGLQSGASSTSTIVPGVKGVLFSTDVTAYRAAKNLDVFKGTARGFSVRDLTAAKLTDKQYVAKAGDTFGTGAYREFVLKCASLDQPRTIAGFVGYATQFGPCAAGTQSDGKTNGGGTGYLVFFAGTRASDGLRVSVAGALDDSAAVGMSRVESVLSSLQKQ